MAEVAQNGQKPLIFIALPHYFRHFYTHAVPRQKSPPGSYPLKQREITDFR